MSRVAMYLQDKHEIRKGMQYTQYAELRLAREALPLAEKVGRLELIAFDCHRLAKALLKQNKNLDEALSLSRRAVEIFTRLRMSENLREAQETLAKIEKAIHE